MNVLELILSTAGAGALTWASTYIIQNIYDRAHERYWQAKHRAQVWRAEEQRQRLESIRILQPDHNGRGGIAYDGRVYRDLDSRAAFTQEINLYFDPVLERLNTIQKTLLAMQAGGDGRARALPEPIQDALDDPGQPWPSAVNLADVLRDRRATIDDLIIGARPTADGLDLASLSIHDLMHSLVIGASGWGKSVWLRALLYQIALAQEPVDVALIDCYGSEFNVLRHWGKLRWPIARELPQAVAMLQAVSTEITDRKTAYENNAPTAANIVDYNRATGAGLPPLLVVVDEGTALMNESGVGDPLRVAVQTARQYGVYVVVAGQSANHRVIPTQVRDNFSSRLCFRTSPTSSRVVLDDKSANELKQKGRMVAQLTGQELQELQGPYVSRQQLESALSNGGPAHDLPDPPDTEDEPDTTLTQDQIEQIRGLWAAGESNSAISEAIFGYRAGYRLEQIRQILESEDW
jgi:hypothetical protein